MTAEAAFEMHVPNLAVARESENRLRVSGWASDPITLTGLIEILMGRHEAFVASADQPASVDVLVLAADKVTAELLPYVRRLVAMSAAPVVLISGELDRSLLLSLVECRVVSILHRRSVNEKRLADAVEVAACGSGSLPPDLLGELMRQVNEMQEEVTTPTGSKSVGLSQREISVVRLLADGCDTEEIGNRLCYSERTVKNIIHTMTKRLNVRNRPQLVAYSVRAGVI